MQNTASTTGQHRPLKFKVGPSLVEVSPINGSYVKGAKAMPDSNPFKAAIVAFMTAPMAIIGM